MILLGLGANLPSPRFGPPRAACEAALAALAGSGVRVRRRSHWYESAAVPAADQPWYVNGVAVLETGFDPVTLLALLLRIEAEMGRIRGEANAPRVIDLDILAYHDAVREGPEPPIVPHPRLAGRAFVLRPLVELAPDWRHPTTGATAAALLAALPPGQSVRRLSNLPAPIEADAP